MTHAPLTPSIPERLGTILMVVTQAVVRRSIWGHLSLPNSLVSAIVNHLREIKQRFALLATLISEGRYQPRRSPAPRQAPPEPATVRKPREPNRLPRKFGWLIPLLPLADANSYRGWVEQLLGDPEMQALLEAAPAAMARPIRSLCWMLRLPPPPALARPPRPRKPKPAPLPAAADTSPPQHDTLHRPQAPWHYRPSANWPRGVGRRWPPPKPKTA